MPKKLLRSLRTRRDFELVFKAGVRTGSKYLVMYARPNDIHQNRLGLSVSKKIGNAVTRNRIKRLMKEAVRKILEGLSVDYDFVIVAKKASAEAKLDDVVRDMQNFSTRLHNEKGAHFTHKAL
jgi:ribonuclease P protein component